MKKLFRALCANLVANRTADAKKIYCSFPEKVYGPVPQSDEPLRLVLKYRPEEDGSATLPRKTKKAA